MPAEPPSTGTIGNVLELPDAPGWEPLGHPISILLLICIGLGFPVQVLTNHPPAVTVAELFFFFFLICIMGTIKVALCCLCLEATVRI